MRAGDPIDRPSVEESKALAGQVTRRLVEEGLIRTARRADDQLWLDHDLASLVENRLGENVDPRSISTAQRLRWVQLATDGGALRSPRGFRACFWLLDRAQRAGTVAFESCPLGRDTVEVASLYVLPSHRRRGLARRLLARATAAAQQAGFAGIRLETEWCWQGAVQAYLAMGFWVRMWKRDLVLVRRRELPPWQLRVNGARAELLMGQQVLLTARRRGDRLLWPAAERVDSRREIDHYAQGTFALALAMRGFPLITSAAAWARQRKLGFSDSGGPVGLAFKIQRFEAWARHHHWRVETPAIPGLPRFRWPGARAQG